MSRTARLIALAMVFAAVFLPTIDAQAHGRWRGGVSIGIGFGVPWAYGPYYAPYYYDYGPGYYYPGTVLVSPPPVAYAEMPAAAPVPPAKSVPEPIFYPNKGQSAAHLEADRQACNRWATTQQNAMADASVFHRATLACMEGRGYTVR
jgi:hypothetical protein